MSAPIACGAISSHFVSFNVKQSKKTKFHFKQLIEIVKQCDDIVRMNHFHFHSQQCIFRLFILLIFDYEALEIYFDWI